MARKCFVCDSSGLIFRQAAYIPECHLIKGKEKTDTVHYNITIQKFTPYKDGKGLCAKGKVIQKNSMSSSFF